MVYAPLMMNGGTGAAKAPEMWPKTDRITAPHVPMNIFSNETCIRACAGTGL